MALVSCKKPMNQCKSICCLSFTRSLFSCYLILTVLSNCCALDTFSWIWVSSLERTLLRFLNLSSWPLRTSSMDLEYRLVTIFWSISFFFFCYWILWMPFSWKCLIIENRLGFLRSFRLFSMIWITTFLRTRSRRSCLRDPWLQVLMISR